MTKIIPVPQALSATNEANQILQHSLTIKKTGLQNFCNSVRAEVPEWMFNQLNFVYLSEVKLPQVFDKGSDKTFKNLMVSILEEKTKDPITYFLGEFSTTSIGRFFEIQNLHEAKDKIEADFKTVFDKLHTKVKLITDDHNHLFIQFTKTKR